MRNKLHKFIQEHGTKICAFASLAATLASNACRFRFYQPEEPEGFYEFANGKKKR